MRAEILFLRYAVPCGFQLVLKNKITQNRLDELERIAIEEGDIASSEIDELFSTGRERREKLYGERFWEGEFVKKYWREDHNGIIAEIDAPDKFKDRCMVHEAKVLKIDNNGMTVTYRGSDLLPENYQGNQIRKVKNVFVPDVNVGDLVTIHFNYAVEKLN